MSDRPRQPFGWLPCRHFVCLLPLAIVGCGEQSNVVSVHGNVTYQGETLSNAAITFFPEIGRPVSAPISEDGGYEISVIPGNYIAVVNVGVQLPPGFKEGDPLPPPKLVLPPQYTLRTKSILQATVAADQSEPIDFALE